MSAIFWNNPPHRLGLLSFSSPSSVRRLGTQCPRTRGRTAPGEGGTARDAHRLLCLLSPGPQGLVLIEPAHLGAGSWPQPSESRAPAPNLPPVCAASSSHRQSCARRPSLLPRGVPCPRVAGKKKMKGQDFWLQGIDCSFGFENPSSPLGSQAMALGILHVIGALEFPKGHGHGAVVLRMSRHQHAPLQLLTCQRRGRVPTVPAQSCRLTRAVGSRTQHCLKLPGAATWEPAVPV